MTDIRQLGRIHQVLHGWTLVERRGAGYRVTDQLRREADRLGALGIVYGLFRADPWSGRTWGNGVLPDARADVAALVQEEVRARCDGEGVLLAEEAAHGLLALGSEVLPTALAQGASWDPELVRAAAEEIGAEAHASGTHLVLTPGLDMLRDPRWGRSEECFGEVPLLSSRMLAAAVQGLQGSSADTTRPDRPSAVVKHFAGQGAPRAGLNASSSTIGPRELSEIHLPVCRAAVEAGARGFMATYNDIDGQPCVSNHRLLTEWLRDECGFGGIVMADAHAVDRLAEAVGPGDAARRALLAGCDVNMGDHAWASLLDQPHLASAVSRSSRRVMALKRLHGVEGPDEASGGPRTSACGAGARRTRPALALARATTTLLKGRLEPFPPAARVVATGPHVGNPLSLRGDYAPPPAHGRATSLADALSSCFDTVVVPWGSPVHPDLGDVLVCQVGGTSERAPETGFTTWGASSSSSADCGEGLDVASIELPAVQDQALRMLRAAWPGRLVVVCVMGRPYVLTTAHEVADDLLLAWYPGEHGAEAIVELLAGRLDPCGRTPVTLLAHAGAVGIHDDDREGNCPARHHDAAEPVLFSVGSGHGRHTTRLISHELLPSATGWRLRLVLTADRPGSELVAVFARSWGDGLWPRRRRLVGWARARLDTEPCASEIVLPRHLVTPTGEPRARLTVPLFGLSFDLS